MSTRFFTNHGSNTLLAKLEGVFHHNPDIEWFDALVCYLRASGYFALRPHLTKVPHVRILVGIDVDEIVSDYHKRGLLFLADPAKALDDFHVRLKEDIQEAAYRPEIETGVLQFVDDVVSGKLLVRAHPAKRLHAKIYIFRPAGFCEHKAGAVITGSSNLTAAGLGSEEHARNYEFNVLLHDYPEVRFASDEFERLWSESVEILPKTVLAVRDSTYLASLASPYEIYFKLLAEYFGPAIDYDPNAVADLPDGYKRLSYQNDAVSSGHRLLEKHGGFFLADVVGLGKTMIAALIAKKFFFHNGFPEHRSHTLVVAPPSLVDTWEETLDSFRIDNKKVVTNGSLHKVRDPKKYDLVIVDEAHKFRNDTSDAFAELQRICKSGTQRRLPDGTNAPKRVILVTATPLNNSPQDIRNLLSLFQDLKHSTLGVANLQNFFAQCEREFRDAKQQPDIGTARRQVVTIYEKIRTRVISEITIRRTRTDLRENEEYSKDLEEQGVVFPTVERPRHILYRLPPDVEALYERTVKLLSAAGPDGLTYNRYRALSFLRAELKQKYRDVDRISQQLAVIMRTLLVKRLDSSFTAFKESLRRFCDATRVMVEMFERGAVYIAPNLPVTPLLLADREDELVALIADRQATDPTIEVCTPADFSDDLLAGLQSDLAKTTPILAEWAKLVSSGVDPKFDEFILRLRGELCDRAINHEGRKLVVFSESKETTEYLRRRLSSEGFPKVLVVDSDSRAALRDEVAANFDANYTGKRRHDFDILISTEVLAEGVNLHRANIVVNYDTPWNATRLMQRVGRLNRIGSSAPRIYIYNFYPTACVDDDIELKKKAIMKLQAFHTALGEDSQIYSTDEEVDSFGLFERSPEEEEKDERLALLMELRAFRRDQPETFRRVAKLPARCRVGRGDNARAFSTVAFIRNRLRDAFYRMRLGGSPEEITLLDAAREFRALDPAEPAIPLHSEHHSQVGAAVEAFSQQVLAEAVLPQVVDSKQGPNERRALAYLDAFLGFDFLSDDERRLIRLGKLAVARARFQSLQRDINLLQRDTKKVNLAPAPLADKVMDILKRYPLKEMESLVLAGPDTATVDTAPQIILSESFDHERRT
jgi:superfamily II DNA or RNA helicase